MDKIALINNSLNGFVWGPIMLVLLVGTGVVMTLWLKGFQFSHLPLWMRSTIGSLGDSSVTEHDKGSAISQFQSVCTALAGTIGTGNIVGVSGAIIAGGPGAIFWMWIVACFGMMTHFCETVLAIYYRKKEYDGEWHGGPMYYITRGLGTQFPSLKGLWYALSFAFAIFTIVASFGIGNIAQINSISGNMQNAFGISPVFSGAFLMFLSGIIVLGGLKRIAGVTEKMIPFMTIAYLVIAIVAIAMNHSLVGPAFVAIFRGAFSLRSAAGGVVGYGVMKALTWGMKRGVFSNEAGLGSSSMVHASSNVKEPVEQGMWGIFEVFADTIIVCTLTSLIVLTSGMFDLSTGAMLSTVKSVTATNLVAESLTNTFGSVGRQFTAIALFFFAFSTHLGWAHYGRIAFTYISSRIHKKTGIANHTAVLVASIIFVLMVFVSATMDLTLAWDISDTFNGLMAIPNLIGVLLLAPVSAKILKNYLDRKKGLKVPPMCHFEDGDALDA